MILHAEFARTPEIVDPTEWYVSGLENLIFPKLTLERQIQARSIRPLVVNEVRRLGITPKALQLDVPQNIEKGWAVWNYLYSLYSGMETTQSVGKLPARIFTRWDSKWVAESFLHPPEGFSKKSVLLYELCEKTDWVKDGGNVTTAEEASQAFNRLFLKKFAIDRDFKDYDGGILVTFPFTHKEAKSYIRKMKWSKSYAGGGLFEGTCITLPFSGNHMKGAFVFENADEYTVEHERTHRDNSGFQVLFIGVEEALAEEISHSNVIARPGHHKKIIMKYPEERILLDNLSRYSGVRHALEARFAHATVDTATNMIAALTNLCGLDTYSLISRATPRPSADNRFGLVPTRTVLSRLTKKK